MKKAKFYIYRNLTRGGFSVRYKGKVIDHADCIMAHGVTYVVNQKGRERVLREKKKYVHAFVACESYKVLDNSWLQCCNDTLNNEVCYNPFKHDSFMVDGHRMHSSDACILGNGKVFIADTTYRAQLLPA